MLIAPISYPTGGRGRSLAIAPAAWRSPSALAGYPFEMAFPKVVRVWLEGSFHPGSRQRRRLEMLRLLTVKGGLGKIFELPAPASPLAGDGPRYHL